MGAARQTMTAMEKAGADPNEVRVAGALAAAQHLGIDNIARMVPDAVKAQMGKAAETLSLDKDLLGFGLEQAVGIGQERANRAITNKMLNNID